jgi:predicted nucleotidyltransferase
MDLQMRLQRLQWVLAGFPEVELAYLFGSQAADLAAGEAGRHTGPLSDYDIAVLLSGGADPLELQARLENAVRRAVEVEKVDVVLLESATIELAKAIISTGIIILEKDFDTRVEYEARVKRYRAALGRTERTLGSLRASAREE